MMPRRDSNPVGRCRTVPGRFLLAEDGPDIQKFMSAFLRALGSSVVIAENGHVAVAKAVLAERQGEPFDLILMDMEMPELDGFAATTELRRLGFRGPIVAVTAFGMPGDRECCLSAGCDDYLAKPIRREVLYSAIERHLSIHGSAVLTSEYAGDPAMTGLIECFVADLPARVASLRNAATRLDRDTLRRLAHQLRGAAGGYGFPQITEAARAVEAAAHDSPELMRARLERLLFLCEKVRLPRRVNRPAGGV